MSQSPPAPEHRASLAAAALAAAVVAALLLLAPRSTLWDRDESRFARSAVEMLSSGDFLVPTFAGELRPHKPPLLPWLMALSASVLGPTATAFRLWSALAHGASVLLTFAAGRRLVGARAALLGAAFLALSPLALLEGAAATADAVLLAGLTGLLAVFADAASSVRVRHFVLGALASAVAQLAKGPVALVLPLLGLGGALLLAGRAFPGRRRLALLLASSSLLGLLPVLGWGLLADAATNGQLLAEALGTHVVGRTLAPMEGHDSGLLFGPLYYAAALCVGFAPWTLFLPGAAARARKGASLGPAARAILLGSAVGPVLLFALVATKLPHYVLPAFPALALLAGEAAEAGERRGLLAGAFLLVPLVLVDFAVLGFVVVAPPLPALRAPAAAAFLALAVGIPAGLAFLRSGRPRAAAAVLLAGTAVALVAGVGFGLPAVEEWKPVPRLAAEARRAVGNAPAATFDFEEPSVFVHLGPGPVERLGNEADAGRWARRAGPGILVTTREGLERLVAREGLLPLVPVAWRGGLNVAKGAPVELVALGRGGPWAKPLR